MGEKWWMNCIYLRQVPGCAALGSGQEYRWLDRNAYLVQIYRDSL